MAIADDEDMTYERRPDVRTAAEALLACFVFDDERGVVMLRLGGANYVHDYDSGEHGYKLHAAALALRDALKGTT